MATPPLEVNVIEFPKPGLEFNAWPRTCRDKVVSALKEHGCFFAKYGMLDGNRSKLFKASKEIFNHLDKTNYGKPEFAYKKEDQYKSFDIPEATTDEGIKKFIPKRWPTGPEGEDDIREDIVKYTHLATTLEDMVREIVFHHYGLHGDKTGYIFRMMKYRKIDKLGCSVDTKEFLAVLDLNQVNGLEMKYGDRQWCKIDVKPSTFLIMAGKLLKDSSKGEINPPELRVKMDGNEERYSVGLFSYYDKGKTEAPKKQAGSSRRA